MHLSHLTRISSAGGRIRPHRPLRAMTRPACRFRQERTRSPRTLARGVARSDCVATWARFCGVRSQARRSRRSASARRTRDAYCVIRPRGRPHPRGRLQHARTTPSRRAPVLERGLATPRCGIQLRRIRTDNRSLFNRSRRLDGRSVAARRRVVIAADARAAAIGFNSFTTRRHPPELPRSAPRTPFVPAGRSLTKRCVIFRCRSRTTVSWHSSSVR